MSVYLIASECKVSALPPDLAAHITVAINISWPILLAIDLFIRLAALVVLGIGVAIEVFVYPQA